MLGDQSGYCFRAFLWHAVPMHLPPGSNMPEESPFLNERQRLPKRVSGGTQTVDCASPVAFLPGNRRSHCSEEVKCGFQCVADPNRGRRRKCLATGSRKQAVTRYRGDPTPMTFLIQTKHHVHHGEARADDENRRKGIEIRGCVL